MQEKGPWADHDNHLEVSATTDFDHDEIDRRLVANDPGGPAEAELREVWQQSSRCSSMGEVLLRLIELLIPDQCDRGTLQSLGVKIITLAWMIGSQKCEIGSMSLAGLAARYGVTRSLLSHWVRHFEVRLGFHARGQRRTSAVPIYQKAAARGWQTRRARKSKADSAVVE